MKVCKRLLQIGLILVSGTFLIACGSKKADTNTASEVFNLPSAEVNTEADTATDVALPDIVNIGVIAGGPESAILIQEKFLESLGVKANIINYSAGTDINNAIVSGDVDLACFGASPIALGSANGIGYKAVFVSYLEGGNIEALVVKKEAAVNEIEDLKGKTIGTPFGTTSHYALLNALKLSGLSASDVTLLDMGGEDIVAAWSRGDIDATYIWSPAQDECIKSDGVIITNDGDLAEQGVIIPEIAVARTEFAEQYPAVVTEYVKALIKVYDVIKNNPDQATKDVAVWEGITEENAKGQVTDNIWVSGENQLSADYLGTAENKGKLADTLKKIIDFHKEQGNLSTAPELTTIQAAIDPTYVEQALR